MDIPQIIAELGGGPGAIMIVGLVIAVVMLWRRNSALQDMQRKDAKEHSAEMLEVVRTLEKAINYIRGGP